jgi:uncharacterized membrane protein YccF (DUF307 family)
MSQIEQRVTRSGPGCLVQALWFAFIGIWASQVWLLLAWLLNLTIIGLPVGVWMLNRIPQIALLREPAQPTTVVRTPNGRVVLRRSELPQHSFILRALYGKKPESLALAAGVNGRAGVARDTRSAASAFSLESPPADRHRTLPAARGLASGSATACGGEIHFLLIGWWFSLIWLEVAWLCCATSLFFPVGLGMFASAPKVVSLRRT